MTRAKGSLAGSIVLGLVGASSALGGFWLHLVALIAGTLFALLTIAQPIHGILGFVVLAPELSPYAQLSLPAGVPDLTFPRAAIALALGAVLLATMFDFRPLRSPVAVEKAMIAFLALIYLDLYIRSPEFESEVLIAFDEFVTPFLFFYLARSLFRARADTRKFLYAMLVTGLVLGVHGIYQYAAFGSMGTEDPVSVDDRSDTGHVEHGRAAGPFINSAEFGGAVGLAWFWGLLLVRLERGPLLRLGLLFALALVGLAAVLSLTRSVWLGMLVGILTVAALDRRWRTVILTGVVVAAIGFGIALATLPSEESRLEERALSAEPLYIRIVMYRAALSMFLERPLFGYGRGETTFVAERQRHLTSVGTIPAAFGNMAGPPHNVYLYTLLQWGLAGLSLYLAVFYGLLRLAVAARSEARSDLSASLAVLFLAGTALYLIQGLFVDVFALTFFTNVYFIGAGVLAGAVPPPGSTTPAG